VVALESIALFRNLGRDELQALRAIAQERQVAAGAFVKREVRITFPSSTHFTNRVSRFTLRFA